MVKIKMLFYATLRGALMKCRARAAKVTVVKQAPKRRYGSTTVRIGRPLKHDAMTASFAKAVSCAAAYKRANHLPVAKYDEKTDRAYLEYPDGRKEYQDET